MALQRAVTCDTKDRESSNNTGMFFTAEEKLTFPFVIYRLPSCVRRGRGGQRTSNSVLYLFIFNLLLGIHESEARRGGGLLPCMGYIGMCGPKGYGFLAVLVINRVSVLADFGHFGHK